ncbi:ABC transporter ATP-binding protein [Virgibacillus salarius]
MFHIENVKVNGIIEIDHLSIEANKVTCIIGKSGSGKSTFLRLVNHLISPNEGNIYFKGKNLSEMDPVQLRRYITMVPQTPVIFDGTVRDNLQIGQKLSGQRVSTDEELDRCLHQLDLHKTLAAQAGELSGGEKQRLALARAMLLDAEVFLLDEPSSALDHTTASKVIHAFVDFIKTTNKTLVMITHDLALAQELADTMIDMNRFSKSSLQEACPNE